MGQNNSLAQEQLPLFLSNYTVQNKNQLGTLLLNNTNQQNYILKQINLMDQNQYRNTLDKYLAKKLNPKQNILNLIEIDHKTKTNFCSATFKIYLMFQYPNISLSDQISARIKQNRLFQEQDLWSIIQSCLGGIAQLEQMIMLDPKKIFIMNDGLVKIVDPDISNDGTKFLLSQGVYYSPQRFQNFNKTQRGNSSQKQMMFSLGMTLLNCSTLKQCFDCYDFDTCKFLGANLEEKINSLNDIYSNQFIFVMQNLLELNPNRRSSILQLQDVIHRFWTKQTKLTEDEISQQKQENVTKLNLQMENQLIEQTNDDKDKQKILNNPPEVKQLCQLQTLPNKITFSSICDVDAPLNKLKKLQYAKQIQSNFMSLDEDKNRFSTLQPRKPFQNVQNKRFQQINTTYIPLSSYSSNIYPIQNNYMFSYDTYKYTNPVTTFNTNQNIFTDPKLLQSLRKDLTQINFRKTMYSNQNLQNRISSVQQQYIPSFKPNTYPKTLANFTNPIYTQSCYKNQFQMVNQKYEDGRIYQGTVINGSKQGHGKLIFTEDGAYYQGSFANNKMHGYGVLYYQIGKPGYEGNWIDDQFHGKGKLYNRDPVISQNSLDFRDFNELQKFWSYYEGQFENDNKHGIGKLVFANGEYFEGKFQIDKINGKGIFYDKFNKKHEGIWQNNILRQSI